MVQRPRRHECLAYRHICTAQVAYYPLKHCNRFITLHSYVTFSTYCFCKLIFVGLVHVLVVEHATWGGWLAPRPGRFTFRKGTR